MSAEFKQASNTGHRFMSTEDLPEDITETNCANARSRLQQHYPPQDEPKVPMEPCLAPGTISCMERIPDKYSTDGPDDAMACQRVTNIEVGGCEQDFGITNLSPAITGNSTRLGGTAESQKAKVIKIKGEKRSKCWRKLKEWYCLDDRGC